MDKETILVVLMIGLVLFSGIQAFQISDLKSNLEENSLAGISGGAVKTAATQSTQIQASQRMQPTMVGGC